MATFAIELLTGQSYLFNFNTSGGTNTITASNGLSISGTSVILGGSLIKDTTISGAYNLGINTGNINLTGSTVNLGGTIKLISTPINGAIYNPISDAVLVWNSSDKIIKKITGITYVEIKIVTGTTYTIQSDDSGKFLEFIYTGDTIIICPTGLTIGFQVVLVNIGGGNKTITAGSGATMYSKNSNVILADTYSVGTIYYRAINKWVLGGDLS